MVVTQQPFSPRPLGPLDTRRRSRRARRVLRRLRMAKVARVMLLACLALGLLWAGSSGLTRAMHMLQPQAPFGQDRLALAGPGVQLRLDLPMEYSARLDPQGGPHEPPGMSMDAGPPPR